MSAVNGSNGHATPAAPPSAIELLTAVASYKTALIALLDMIKRQRNEWRSVQDQMLIREVERLLAQGPPDPGDAEKK